MIRKRHILRDLHNPLFYFFSALRLNFNTRNTSSVPVFKIFARLKKKRNYLLFNSLILLFIIIFYTGFNAGAAERVNPFKPLFKDNFEQAKDIKSNKNDINPLLNYDISELRLAAILQSKNKRFALFEDNTGKGYIILKGDRIGSELYSVVDILQDKVIIKNIFGVKREIALNKEDSRIGG